METPPTTDQLSADPTQAPLTRSGLAVAALILGLVGCIPPLGIIALILGLIAIARIDDPANRLTGKGLAIAGAVIGGATTFLIVPLALMIGVLVPSLGASTRPPRTQSMMRARGICSAMIQYSQSNQGQYPGLGMDNDLTVEGRFQLMLDGQFFTYEYLISPMEEGVKQPAYSSVLTTSNYSYALLQVPKSGGRRYEWAATMNYEAPAVSDRNTAAGPGTAARSVHSDSKWRGAVGYNDNHTVFETSNVLSNTRFGNTENTNDDMFATTSNSDAYLIYSGNE